MGHGETEDGAIFIQIERRRQFKKGFDLHNDLKYFNEELIDAAICYLGQGSQNSIYIDEIYPWAESTFKPSTLEDKFEARMEDIVKAGAMITAHLTVMSLLRTTKEQLRYERLNLHGCNVYFKLDNVQYYGYVESSITDESSSTRTHYVKSIKNLHTEEDASFETIELQNDEIWTFI